MAPRSLLLAAAALVVLLPGCGSGKLPAATAPSVTAPSATASPATTPPEVPAPSTAGRPLPNGPVPHVMVVVLENREATEVLGGGDAPYLNSLARRYGLATESFARTHPSLPDYLELISGGTQGISSDCTECSADGATLVDQLSAAGISWKAYMEGIPVPCYRGASSDGGYDKNHDPFVYFRHVVGTPALCDRVVPYGRMATDLRSGDPPAFVWVTPNVCDDGHDCDTSTMDRWLSRSLAPVLSSAWYAAGGVVIITFDEGSTDAGCCRVASGGRVDTVVVTNRVPGGRRWDQPVDTAGVLATVEDLYGLGRLGEAASASAGNLLYLTGPGAQ